MRGRTLTIADKCIEAIDRLRQKRINEIISSLHGLILYFHLRTRCTFACSSILLGALTKQMKANGLLEPKPKRPFLGYSVAGTTAIVCGFITPRWSTPKTSRHACTLQDFIDKLVISFTDAVLELHLEEFSRHHVGMTGL